MTILRIWIWDIILDHRSGPDVITGEEGNKEGGVGNGMVEAESAGIQCQEPRDVATSEEAGTSEEMPCF